VEGVDWYQVRTLSGEVLAGGFLVGGGSPPRLPTHIPAPMTPDPGDPAHERVAYFTVPARTGSGSFRVRASTDPQYPSRVLLIAASLQDVLGTLHRLLLIEVLVTAAALAGIAGIGFWVVRLGLRPLGAIEATAAAIAAGDLSRRVQRAEPRTEVGRLGLSLNAMLGQIEAAFRAREQSEAKLRRFVADASHELRTPLAAVRAYAELFGRGAAQRPADLARSMSGITRETERMSLLVDDLLLLARLDEGRPLEQAPVDLAELIGEAVDAARVLEPARPIDVILQPATVAGDHARLRQVIDNLLANVRTHTPAHTPVTVSLKQTAGQVQLQVADQGPGLSPEQAAHVFERFYRVDDSRTRASGGVGLGLSIVAAIARAHGGSARAESTPGGGATFIVTLPLTNG
jgi:two-component system OmpR family sensor kinase